MAAVEALALLSLIGCCWMTLCAAFYWNSFLWSLLFCTLHFFSYIWLDSEFKPYNDKSEPAACAGGLGMICTFLGVFMLLVPEIGLSLFRIVFNIGSISTIGSILFVFVDKTFDEVIHSLANAAYDALTRYKAQVETRAEVLVMFFCELMALISPTSRQKTPIYISKHEIMTTLTEKEQKELFEKLDQLNNVGKKIIAGALIWARDIIFWIIHAWYADARHFGGLFILGAGCTVAGIWLRNMPEFGLTPFIVGNLCITFSTFFLKEPFAQLFWMFDNTRADSVTWMIISFVLTHLTIFWWDSVVLASFFCVLYIVSTAWYCLSYVTLGRFAVKKALSVYFSEPR